MSTDTTLPLTLTIPDACKLANCGRSSIYRAMWSGQLPAKKLGAKVLILRSDLEAWLQDLPAAFPAKPRLAVAK